MSHDSTTSPVTQGLRTYFGCLINRNGQFAGNIAFNVGTDTKGRANNIVHMRCGFCGHDYMAAARSSGRTRCPKCDEGQSERPVPEKGGVTRSEIRPQAKIDREEFEIVKNRLVLNEHNKKRGLIGDHVPDLAGGTDVGAGVTAAQGNGGVKEQLDLNIDRAAALAADDGPNHEALVDLDNCAEIGRTTYQHYWGDPFAVWDEAHESTRDVWRNTTRAILKAAGVRV